MPLISCEVSLILTCSGNCVITSKAYRKADSETAVVRINNLTGATFKITGTKLYVPIVTLSAQDENKLKD